MTDGDKLGGKLMRMMWGLDKIAAMPTMLIVKPYKAFAKAAAKLCLMFSFALFISVNPLLNLALVPAYIRIFYITNTFINFCVKYGYKKIMLVIIFIILYFLVFTAVSYLRGLILAL